MEAGGSTGRLLRAARLVLWIEGLGQAAWPVVALAAALAGVALLGLPALLPVWLHWLLLIAVLGGLAWLAARGAASLRRPGVRQAESRLEQDSGLRHRPFAVLRDQPAGADAAARDLWRLHRARAEAALTHLRLRPPHPVLASADPRALRAASVLLLAAGLVVAGPQAPGRLVAALLPGLPSLFGGAPPLIQAWIQPPAYTGLAPIFLPAGGGAVSAPAGSRLTVSITGLQGRPHLMIGHHDLAIESLGNDSFEATATLAAGGRLAVTTFFSTLAGWDLAVVANAPPLVAWAALPGRAGSSLSTRLPWQVQQLYGVAALEAALRPQNHPELPAIRVPLPLPGTPKKATGAATLDLSANPYAGLMMTGRLRARDVSGQQANSGTADFVLPAREFHQPLARAIVDLRRRLALHPDAPQDAAADLAALAEAPIGTPAPGGLSAAGITLNLAAAAALLTPDGDGKPDPAQIADVQGRLWTLALALDGALPDAASRELAEARDNLKRGLEDRAHGKLTDRELAKRLETLRQALDKRLDDIARQAMKQGALQKFDPDRQHLSSSTMDRLMNKLEKAMQDGRMADARQAMKQLERMMDQLKNAHIQTPEQAQQQQQAAKRGRQMLGAVQDMVQRESRLLDHAQARAPHGLADQPPAGILDPNFAQQFRGFDFQPQPNGTDDGAPASPDRAPPPAIAPEPHDDAQTEAQAAPPQGAGSQQEDARTQRALHRALDALKQGFAQSGHKPPRNLDDAGHAMEDAANALTAREDSSARDAVARAIAALQQGGQDMSRQMSEQSGSAGMQLSLEPGGQGGGEGDEGADEPGDGQGGRKKDPFGRQVDGNGTTADDSDLKVPDDMEQGRSRAIQEELRKRGADRQRSKEELDYIDRLLKPF